MVFDYLPAGLDYMNDPVLNMGWTLEGDILSYTYIGELEPGSSVQLQIYMAPNGEDFTNNGLTNIAEIGQVFNLSGFSIGQFDIDSTPDSSPDNDAGGESGGDEDDADIAEICLIAIDCPEDIELTESCVVAPFETAAEAGLLLSGNSCADIDFELTVGDVLEPVECTNGDFHPTRTVNRSYRFFSENAGIDSTCVQTINYSFTECNQLADAGMIGIEGNSVLTLPTASCSYIPPIMETDPAVSSDGCDTPLVEHMWLISTQERSNGAPFIPTNLNIGPAGSGSIWEIINDATNASYQPDGIAQNTYFVRCTRDISCCDFVETNLVGYRIDADAATGDDLCPVAPIVEEPEEDDNIEVPLGLVQECEEEIIFSVWDNMAGQEKEYQTNWTIDASNTLSGSSFVRFNAKDGTTLQPGFEVQSDSQLEIKTEGCND